MWNWCYFKISLHTDYFWRTVFIVFYSYFNRPQILLKDLTVLSIFRPHYSGNIYVYIYCAINILDCSFSSSSLMYYFLYFVEEFFILEVELCSRTYTLEVYNVDSYDRELLQPHLDERYVMDIFPSCFIWIGKITDRISATHCQIMEETNSLKSSIKLYATWVEGVSLFFLKGIFSLKFLFNVLWHIHMKAYCISLNCWQISIHFKAFIINS